MAEFGLIRGEKPELGAGVPGVYNLGDVSGAITIDFAIGRIVRMRMTGNVSGITYSNMKEGVEYTILAVQDGTGSRTVAWGTVSWTGAAAPTLTVTANRTDMIRFVKVLATVFGNSVLNHG